VFIIEESGFFYEHHGYYFFVAVKAPNAATVYLRLGAGLRIYGRPISRIIRPVYSRTAHDEEIRSSWRGRE